MSVTATKNSLKCLSNVPKRATLAASFASNLKTLELARSREFRVLCHPLRSENHRLDGLAARL